MEDIEEEEELDIDAHFDRANEPKGLDEGDEPDDDIDDLFYTMGDDEGNSGDGTGEAEAFIEDLYDL
jgi:hypothetical protein